MHYKNGRQAKSGDIVLNLNDWKTGVLHSLNLTNDICNGRLAQISQNDAYINIKDCVHLDDIKVHGDKIPSSIKE